MGIFDKIFGNTSKPKNTGGQTSAPSPSAGTPSPKPASASSGSSSSKPRPIPVILREIAAEQHLSVRENLSIDLLEQEYGTRIYNRLKSYASPDPINFAVYNGSKRVLMIRLWDRYGQYNHYNNRLVREFCDAHDDEIMDFFLYMPNEEQYVSSRIRTVLQKASAAASFAPAGTASSLAGLQAKPAAASGKTDMPSSLSGLQGKPAAAPGKTDMPSSLAGLQAKPAAAPGKSDIPSFLAGLQEKKKGGENKFDF